MRIVTFERGTELALGVSTDRGVLDLSRAASEFAQEGPFTPADFFREGRAALADVQEVVDRASAHRSPEAELWLREDDLTLGPCVPQPGKIMCVGLNYLRHAEESGMDPPETPVLFSKFQNAITAHGRAVALPAVATEYDYEAELVVVIGTQARNVHRDHALDYVLGYCNGNDVSARELQTRTSQWLLGKSLDGFLPIGPYLVTSEEVGDPQTLSVRCWLNGDLRQNSNTADMIFDVATIVSYVSTYMPLEPGDIISTGTPEGVIFGRREKAWMKAGDVVEVEVGPLGRIANPLVAG